MISSLHRWKVASGEEHVNSHCDPAMAVIWNEASVRTSSSVLGAMCTNRDIAQVVPIVKSAHLVPSLLVGIMPNRWSALSTRTFLFVSSCLCECITMSQATQTKNRGGQVPLQRAGVACMFGCSSIRKHPTHRKLAFLSSHVIFL